MPAAILKVPAEMPELGHGDTLEKPMPAPNANSARVSAAAVTPPAITAAQETADSAIAPDEISVLPSAIATVPAVASQSGQLICQTNVPGGWKKDDDPSDGTQLSRTQLFDPAHRHQIAGPTVGGDGQSPGPAPV